MLEVVVAAVEGDGDAFELSLELGHLLLQGVQLAFRLCPVADVQAVYFLGEHQHPVLGYVLG